LAIKSRAATTTATTAGRRRAGTTTRRAATGPDGRTGEGEGFVTAVDAEVGVGIGGLVGARELDEGRRGAGAAVLDADLGAGDEVLGLVDVRRVDAYDM
jgi:hypothetical protein